MKNSKILIIDDDVDLIESIQIVLQANNFDVVSSISSQHAFDLVIKEKPDLVLLDVMFPEDSTAGFKICKELKENPETKMIPIIMLSAINPDFNMAFSESIGRDDNRKNVPADAFFEKPINPENLMEVIRHVIKTNRQE